MQLNMLLGGKSIALTRVDREQPALVVVEIEKIGPPSTRPGVRFVVAPSAQPMHHRTPNVGAIELGMI
jgi:hypothetical protein